MVDTIRLRIADVLRHYARKDPGLGYTQGMCFAAAVICLKHSEPSPSAEHAFEALMSGLRQLWLPGFPMVTVGTPILEDLLRMRDPELVDHLQAIELDFSLFVPGAWLSFFAKWLPLSILQEALPFLGREGLVGFLSVTLLLLLYHREALLCCPELEAGLAYLNRLSDMRPPEGLLEMCIHSLPAVRSRLSGPPRVSASEH